MGLYTTSFGPVPENVSGLAPVLDIDGPQEGTVLDLAEFEDTESWHAAISYAVAPDAHDLTADAIIAKALSYKGYHEKDGATRFGEWWDKRHDTTVYAKAAWCDMFLSECAYEVGGDDAKDAFGEFAYTPWHAAWFARLGRFGNAPKKGAAVFFNFEGSKSISAIQHIGLVIGVDPDGRVVTIEGNTSDQVAQRWRARSTIVGFGYPRYAAPAPKPQPKPVPAKPVKTDTAPKFPLPATDWFGQATSAHAHASGAAVRQIQTQLNHHGAHLAVDGAFGPKTELAVQAFQHKHGLKVDGAVGPRTWAALWNAPTN